MRPLRTLRPHGPFGVGGNLRPEWENGGRRMIVKITSRFLERAGGISRPSSLRITAALIHRHAGVPGKSIPTSRMGEATTSTRHHPTISDGDIGNLANSPGNEDIRKIPRRCIHAGRHISREIGFEDVEPHGEFPGAREAESDIHRN